MTASLRKLQGAVCAEEVNQLAAATNQPPRQSEHEEDDGQRQHRGQDNEQQQWPPEERASVLSNVRNQLQMFRQETTTLCDWVARPAEPLTNDDFAKIQEVVGELQDVLSGVPEACCMGVLATTVEGLVHKVEKQLSKLKQSVKSLGESGADVNAQELIQKVTELQEAVSSGEVEKAVSLAEQMQKSLGG
mmetsp:Transcript_4832/g.11812  ORF Transcript_4832/g.11812 Transcript_4832/m.11812 type:complete len:190 (-) Transcript_4832:62-631(-)